MIQHLLETLITHLKKNLPEVKQIQQEPVSLAPSIALYEFEFAVKNTSLSETTIQEFQQEMRVEIYDNSPAALEKWTSLTLGIILSDSDKIIKACNQRAKDSPYRSERFSITHLIDHIQLVGGIPSASESLFQWQLKFKVSGHLKLSKNIGDGVIEEIIETYRDKVSTSN
jgi:hypothetical protein